MDDGKSHLRASGRILEPIPSVKNPRRNRESRKSSFTLILFRERERAMLLRDYNCTEYYILQFPRVNRAAISEASAYYY